MSFEGIDEWDENFLDEAIRVELEALASRNPPANPPEPTSPPPASSRRQPDTIVASVERAHARISLDSDAEPEPFFPVSRLRLSARVSAVDGGGGGDGGSDSLNFSPPRELSQRYVEKPNSKVDSEIIQPSVSRNEWYGNRRGEVGTERDREVGRLKDLTLPICISQRELGRVSKHLKHLEQECVELKNERAKKDEQIKCAFLEIEAKEAEIHKLKRGNLDYSRLDFQITGACGDQVCHCPVNGDKCARQTSQSVEVDIVHSTTKGEIVPEQNILNKGHIWDHTSLTTCTAVNVQEGHIPNKAAMSKGGRTVGTQTEKYQDFGCTWVDSTEDHISSELLTVWDSPNSIMTGRNIISRLLVSCTADFCALFRCMSMTSNINLDRHADEKLSHTNLSHDAQFIASIDASKVSRLYATLAKMHNGMTHLSDLLEALLDICTVENAFVVHRSLRILCTILQHLLSRDKRSNKRKNVLLGQPLNDSMNEDLSLQDWNQTMGKHHKNVSCDNENSGFLVTDMRSFNLEHMCSDEEKLHNDIKLLSSEKLVSIFKSMQLIVMGYTKECILVEALQVMILIMMESDPNTERNKFGLIALLEVVPKLLQKEAGLHVQKHALRLLFLLLNCPKMLMLFSNGDKNSPELTETIDCDEVALQGAVNLILEGLSECLSLPGTGNLELKLRKQAIILLAYVASGGKSGFEVLLKLVRPESLNFLQLIVQILATEMDVENVDCANAQALCNERTLLLREALILLNRLSSHPMYSRATLEALVSSNPMASLTIDVVSRLPHRSRVFKHDDANKTQMAAETMDLARLFRARVFAFLGGKQTS